jgi:hypothetical protein
LPEGRLCSTLRRSLCGTPLFLPEDRNWIERPQTTLAESFSGKSPGVFASVDAGAVVAYAFVLSSVSAVRARRDGAVRGRFRRHVRRDRERPAVLGMGKGEFLI